MPQYAIAIVHGCIFQMSDWLSKQSTRNTTRDTHISEFFISSYIRGRNYKNIYIAIFKDLCITVLISHNLPFLLILLQIGMYSMLDDIDSDIQWIFRAICYVWVTATCAIICAHCVHVSCILMILYQRSYGIKVKSRRYANSFVKCMHMRVRE